MLIEFGEKVVNLCDLVSIGIMRPMAMEELCLEHNRTARSDEAGNAQKLDQLLRGPCAVEGLVEYCHGIFTAERGRIEGKEEFSPSPWMQEIDRPDVDALPGVKPMPWSMPRFNVVFQTELMEALPGRMRDNR